VSSMGRAAGSAKSFSGRLSPVPVLQVATGFWGSQALLTAVDLRIFTLLFGGPKSAKELAQEAKADPVAVEALLDANCALGFVHRVGEKYRNDDVSNAYLVEGVPGSYIELLRFMRQPLQEILQGLPSAARTGRPTVAPEKLPATQVEAARAFHMGAYATMMRVAEILDLEFSAYSRMLDLGGHTGAGSLCLARRYPHLTAVVRDHPAYQSLAEEYIRGVKLEERVRFSPGDPDRGEPGAEYDLALLGNHLSRRPTAALPQILAAVATSLRRGGMLLVTDFLLEDSRSEPREAALFRLNVLATYGSEYAGALTRSSLYGLLRDAGFSEVDMVGLPMFGITAITALRA
jgi:3-hydroxy-5-methyl-1-naphthoate 3-O-methyltransferase